jgi:hypothetical protein
MSPGLNPPRQAPGFPIRRQEHRPNSQFHSSSRDLFSRNTPNTLRARRTGGRHIARNRSSRPVRAHRFPSTARGPHQGPPCPSFSDRERDAPDAAANPIPSASPLPPRSIDPRPPSRACHMLDPPSSRRCTWHQDMSLYRSKRLRSPLPVLFQASRSGSAAPSRRCRSFAFLHGSRILHIPRLSSGKTISSVPLNTDLVSRSSGPVHLCSSLVCHTRCRTWTITITTASTPLRTNN